MNPVKIVFKNMRQRLLSTLLTIASVALAAALVVSVQTLERETEQNYTQTSVGYDLILAATGSRMQATLNSIYHLESSTGVIPYAVHTAALSDRRITESYPFFVGDNYRGVRIVGTSPGFILESQPRAGQQFNIMDGRIYEKPFEAVIGYAASERLGVGIGHRFTATHGVTEAGDAEGEAHVHDEFEFEIVGILDQSRTAHDNVIFTSIYSTYVTHYDDEQLHESHSHEDDHNHDHDHDEEHAHDHGLEEDAGGEEAWPLPLSEYENRVERIDAVLLKFENQAAAVQLAGMLNFPTPQNPLLRRNMMRDPFFQHKEELMGVIPAVQIQELMSIVGNAEQVLRAIGWLVFAVALFGVLVAIYNTMEERRRDIAIMRSLGARRGTIVSLILMEAGFITLLGCLIGLGLSVLSVALLAPYIAETAGIFVSAYAIEASQLVTLASFVVLGLLAGIIPALKAYKTDVVSHLTP
jgi:putative ABC transport system permease protein